MRRTVQENNKRRKEKINNKANKKTIIKCKLDEAKEAIKKIIIDKKMMNIIVILFLLVICIIVVNNYAALGLVINKNITSNDAVNIQLRSAIKKILPFKNGVLVYSKGRIEVYNNYGKNTVDIELEGTIDVDIVTSGEYIQITNKDKKTVYVYRNQYEVARIKLDGEIHSANINDKGMSVIEYSSNSNKVILGIYDNSGNLKYNIKPSNNIIGKYVLSDNAKYLAYTDVDISGISAYTNINLINLSNIKEGQTSASIIYTVDNALAYDIYWHGRNVITRLDNKYVSYNISSEKVDIIPISGGQLLNIDDYDKRYAYTELDSSGDYLLRITKMGSDKLKTVMLDDTPKYFEYEDGIVYVCYSKKIEAYNNSGIMIKRYDSDMVITEPVVFNAGRSLAMALSNKLIIFTI